MRQKLTDPERSHRTNRMYQSKQFNSSQIHCSQLLCGLLHGAFYFILKETLPDRFCDQCQKKMLRFECAPQSSDVTSFIPRAGSVGRRSLTRDPIMRTVLLLQERICYEELIRLFLPCSLEFSYPSTIG